MLKRVGSDERTSEEERKERLAARPPQFPTIVIALARSYQRQIRELCDTRSPAVTDRRTHGDKTEYARRKLRASSV